MKILVVTQYYWPENTRITDVAESLAKMGNKVTVLTGLPNYPEGYIYDGYRKGENRVQEHNGVEVLRAKVIARRRGPFFRLLNYYSFPYFAGKLAKRLPNDFDVVLAMESSPIMLVRPAIEYAKKNGVPSLMYEMDLWPESLLAGGISNGSIAYKYYRKVSAKLYSSFSKIVVSTKEHIPYIRELPECAKLNLDYLAQCADSVFEETSFGDKDNGVVDLMFAGNMGKAQSIDTIIRAAELLKNDSRFRFHMVGDGSELVNAKRLANDLGAANVLFYGKRKLSDMPALYEVADAMLVTLEDKPYANMTIPGKVQSYMAVGKPIIGAINGACRDFIINNQIGYVVSSGDYQALATLISGLSINDLRKIGHRSREVYKNKYSRSIFLSRLASHLQNLIS